MLQTLRTRWKYLPSLLIIGLLFSSILTPKVLAKTKKKSAKTSPTLIEIPALILSGQHEQARRSFRSKQAKKITGKYRNRLRFMKAYLLLNNQEYEASAKIFKELRKDYPLLKDYTDFYLALAYRDADKSNQAIAILTELKTKPISRYLLKKIDRELALAYCKAGDRGTAIEMLNGLIQTEPSDIKSYHLRFDRSFCLIQLGSPQEAVPSLRNLYLNYPEGDLNDKIIATLKQIKQNRAISSNDHLRRGEQLMKHKRPKLAAQDFAIVVEGFGGNAPGTLIKKLANAYFKSRQYPLAAQWYEKLRDQHPAQFDSKARLRLAQAYSRSDQFNKAIAAYEDLLARTAGGQNSRLEYKIAFLHMDKGDLGKANELFTQILGNHPKHRRRAQMLWFLAWNNYLLKNYEQALDYLSSLQSEFPRNRFAKSAPYWRARILGKQGKSEAATAAYRAIAERNPFSYYGFISLKRLENKTDPKVPPQKSWAQEIPRLKIPPPFSMSRLQAGGKRSIQRVKELLLLGLWEDFLGELNLLTTQEGISGDLRNLKAGVEGRNDVITRYSSERWSNSYPAAYATLVSLFSNIRNFPRSITWAIMREESRFRPQVISSAQAIGLMQIIPPTGTEIANDLRRKGFVPESLNQPVTNIEFGVHYLNKNLKRFGGKLPQTIASYNAGPDAVSRWIKARPNREWDEFIEEIPYRETNLYVKKVLKSYYIYQLLYGQR